MRCTDYSLQLLFDSDKGHHVGSTVPIKLALFDQDGRNVSSAKLMVTPIRLARVGDTTAFVVDDAEQADADNTFRYDDSLAPGGWLHLQFVHPWAEFGILSARSQHWR